MTIPDTATKAYTTTNYWQVADPNDSSFIAKISEWCATCHTRYLSSTSYTESGDAVFTQRHISNQTEQGKASCIQCHVAHGSNAGVSGGTDWGVHSREGVPAPADSYLLRIDEKGTCGMCHN